ncbi:tRNA adenosine(34) deaminase TadA [Lapidilactobacillus luobeiensis]|uniref:tRNA adenosine(34) deaminase TadA n=1 Tax=Lapidilactobacillus luobeiensis TaxID=2950371 RepID=UPI0021C3FDEB|nr:tRNA adenosine(34) deaminase TadA [Lapidilactobacillus luobeiensis]
MISLVALTAAQKERYMAVALAEAKKAAALGEVPIGAVIELDGQIIAQAHNLRETSQDATDHAETMAIRQACQTIGSWRLERCRLFVTLEPCPMCAGAIINSRIAEVYYGAPDPKAGAAGTLVDLLRDTRFNHQPLVFPDVEKQAAQELLQQFFRAIRQRQKMAKRHRQEQARPDPSKPD